MIIKKILRAFCLFFVMIHFDGCAQQKENEMVEKPKRLIRPEYLKKGDSIAIVAPAGILKNRKKAVQKAKKLMESWGLNVVLGKHIFNQNYHFSGTDYERSEDFQKALDNPSIKAIWAARGGYGSVRILDKLDFAKFKKHPKWIVGYSDITAFHSHIHTLGVETIHGMMATSLEYEKGITETIESLRKTVFGKKLSYKIKSSKYNREGTVNGQLVGGNIAILTSMLGSRSQIYTHKKIVFIEEVGEYKYSIDRMLQSLKRAGFFESCKGVIIGDMTNIKHNSTAWGSSIEQLILEALQDYDFPILFDFPAGHKADNRALILGRRIKLSVSKENSTVVFE